MAIPPQSAASLMCGLGVCRYSNLDVQKLLYFAHAIHLVLNEGRPLVAESFESWSYGPIIPSLYHVAKRFGADPIGAAFFSEEWPDRDSTEGIAVRTAHELFGDWKKPELVNLSHREGGAWAKNYRGGKSRGAVIPDKDIYDEFTDILVP